MLSALPAIACPSSVCPCITRVDQSKTVEVRIMKSRNFNGLPLVQGKVGK